MGSRLVVTYGRDEDDWTNWRTLDWRSWSNAHVSRS